MSNHLAVATVTGALHTQLLNATALVPGASVTTTRPNGARPIRIRRSTYISIR